MNLTVRIGLATSIAAGLAVTFSCSAPPDSQTEGISAEEAAEGIQPNDALLTRGYLPPNRRGQAAKAAKVAAERAVPNVDARDLTYRGGPLIQKGKVALVFWNTKVAFQSQLPGYFQTVGDSPYFDLLSQYDTGGKHIGRASYLGAFTDPSAPAGATVTNANIGKELERLISNGNVPAPDDDTLYMIYFPPGVSIDLDGQGNSCSSFCAYHYTYTRSNGQNVYYGVMPDLSTGACAGGGCGPNSAFDNLTLVSSHEWAEATTDPAVGLDVLSWYNDSYGEIGDICAWQGPGGRIGSYLVQEEWSNSDGACVFLPSGGQDGGTDGGGDGGTDGGGDGGTDGGGDGGTDGGGTCDVGDNESEPNDDYSTADALGAGLCGGLSNGDRDMATFDVAKGKAYDAVLTATGDATLKVYHVGKTGKLNRVANTSPTEVKHVSATGGTYVTLVASASGASQSYTLTASR